MDGPRGSKSDSDDSYEDYSVCWASEHLKRCKLQRLLVLEYFKRCELQHSLVLARVNGCKLHHLPALECFKCCKLQHLLVLERLKCCKLQYFKRTTGPPDQRTTGPEDHRTTGPEPHQDRATPLQKKPWTHLYSGGQRWHLPTHCREVLEIDLTRGVDMRNSSIWTYVLSLALEGKIVAVISGPPCRSVSQLRCDTDGGPPVVRDRSGPTRFFQSVCEQLAHDDITLFLKALFLYDVAVEARKALGTSLAWTSDAGVYFALENPQDPA